MSSVALGLRVLVAAVFLAAATGKLLGRDGFRAFAAELVRAGVRSSLARPAGFVIVATELAVAGLAPWPRTGLAGTAVATALLAVFTIGTARAIRRGTTARCRCFGSHGARLNRSHVVRNTALTAVAALALVLTAASAGAGLSPVGAGLAVAMAALGTTAVVFWDDVVFVLLEPARR